MNKKVVLQSDMLNPYHYQIFCTASCRGTYKLNVRSKHRLLVDGCIFYVNFQKSANNEYHLTEATTGYGIFSCPTNDPYIMKYQLQDMVNDTARWAKFKRFYNFVHRKNKIRLFLFKKL